MKISLSSADILVGITSPFYFLMNYSGFSYDVMTRKWLCLIALSTLVISGNLSLYSLVLVSVDRYITVFYPLRYSTLLNQRKINVILLLIWLYFACVGSIPLFGLNQWDICGSCTILDVYLRSYTIAFLFPHITIGLIIAGILYGKIFYIAHKQRKQMDKLAFRQEKSNSNHKSAKLMAFVLLIFLLCWFPYIVTTMMSKLYQGEKDTIKYTVLVYALEISKIILFGNSFLNPLIYGWKSKEFRKAYKSLLRIRTSKVKPGKPLVSTIGTDMTIEDFDE